MKKFKLSIIMAVFAFIAMLPLQTFAAEAEEVSVTCTPKENTGYKQYDVTIHIPNASKEQIASVSLKLDVTPDPKNSSTGYSSMVEFSKDVTGKAKVYEYRAGNTLNIYIAGTKALFEEDKLYVGTVSMKNSVGEALALDGENGVRLDSASDALMVVRGFGGAEIPYSDAIRESDTSGDVSGDIPPKPEGDNSGDPDNSDNMGVPGGSGRPGSDTAKDQYDNNRKAAGSRTQGVMTGDVNTIVIYVVSVIACLGIISVVAYRKRKAR